MVGRPYTRREYVSVPGVVPDPYLRRLLVCRRRNSPGLTWRRDLTATLKVPRAPKGDLEDFRYVYKILITFMSSGKTTY